MGTTADDSLGIVWRQRCGLGELRIERTEFMPARFRLAYRVDSTGVVVGFGRLDFEPIPGGFRFPVDAHPGVPGAVLPDVVVVTGVDPDRQEPFA